MRNKVSYIYKLCAMIDEMQIDKMSLKQIINKEIESKFPIVYQAKFNKKSKILNWIYSRNFLTVLSFYSTLLFLIVIYTKLIDFEFLKILTINFDETIKTFTTGIITLVSMNLFVTNLLLTHLKDERDDIQSIIDRKVNFKFITYLGFTLIIFVLCLYFFSPTIDNIDIKSNILIFVFSSFISYIFLLVFLYNTVFNFIHKTKRTEIVKSELHLEFHNAFYNDYFKRKFNEEYKNLMENKLNFEPYKFWQNIEGINHYSHKISKTYFLNDVNVKAISKLSKKIISSKKFYHVLELGKEYQKNSELKLFSLFEKENLSYKNVYSFSSKNSFQTEYDKEYLNKLLKKIDDSTITNKYNELYINLKNLEDIYSEYIELENEI